MADVGTQKYNFQEHWQKFSGDTSVESMMQNENAHQWESDDRRDVIDALPDLSGLRVLETGAGIGRFTAELAKRAKHVTTSDFIESFVEENKRRNEELGNLNVEYSTLDVTKLEVKPNCFDFVFTNWMLEYLTDAELFEFLTKCMVCLVDHGQMHIRESCSHASSPDHHFDAESNPTFYRHVSIYLALLETFRWKNSSGQVYRFDIEWGKSINTYIRTKHNWRQVHLLLRKIPVLDDDMGNDNWQECLRNITDARKGHGEFENRLNVAEKDHGGYFSDAECQLKKHINCLSSSPTSILNIGLPVIGPFTLTTAFNCHVLNVCWEGVCYSAVLGVANKHKNSKVRFEYQDLKRKNAVIKENSNKFDLIIIVISDLLTMKDLDKVLMNVKRNLADDCRLFVVTDGEIDQNIQGWTKCNFYCISTLQPPEENGFLKSEAEQHLTEYAMQRP